jgi:poly-gamma-glutamate synthesis protein (capsule biosynthesis protein)
LGAIVFAPEFTEQYVRAPDIVCVGDAKLMRHDFLTLAAWSRFKGLRNWVQRRIASKSEPFAVPKNATRVLFGGDINFDPNVRMMWHLGLYRVSPRTAPRTLRSKVKGKLWRKFVQPMLSAEFSSGAIEAPFFEFSLGKPAREDEIVADHFAQRTRPAEVDWATVGTDWDFPFRRISSFLQKRDLVVMNLETPLTNHVRDNGLFKSNPNYAQAMRRAGIKLVNLSNNHIFDAGEEGFYDTLDHLKHAGVECIGVGNNIEHARTGKVIEIAGIRCCFLSYTQFCNSRFASLVTAASGVLPLDRRLMLEDVHRAKRPATLVIVSLHWGFENQPNVHPAQIEIAHDLVDAGAACIIGHHPHVPHAIEVYRGCPIIYSLGNFIFAQRNHPCWYDNFLCELILLDTEVRAVLIHPIAGRGGSLFQPEILKGSAGEALLENLRIKSIPFRTDFNVFQGVGYLNLSSTMKSCPRPMKIPSRQGLTHLSNK